MVREKVEVARNATRDAFAPLSPESRGTLAALLGAVVEPWLAEVTRTGPPPAAPSGSPPRAARPGPPPG